MRHVHDGELHAFLDGALDLLPEGRGEEVREHISHCSACRERLQDEESVRSEAQSLLGDPDFSEMSLPTFEELRRRAEALGPPPPASPEAEEESKPRYRGPLKGLPLAWAATVVLAAGVGWMGGQVWRGLPSESRDPGFATGESYPVQFTGVPGDSLSQEQADAVEEEVPPAVAPAPEGLAPERALEETPGDAGPGGAQSSISAVERRREAPAEDSTSQTQASKAVGEATGAERLLDTTSLGSQALALEAIVVTGSVDMAPPPTVQGLPTLPRDMARTSEALRFVQTPEAAAPDFRAEDSPSDTTSLVSPYAIPGLEVVSVEWEERVPGERALLIRQLMAQGDTLELRVLGMLLGTDPEPEAGREVVLPSEGAGIGRVYANILEASLPPGWHQVVMEKGRVLLVARGPLSEGNLKGLLKTLR